MRVILLFKADASLPDPSRGHPDGAQTYEQMGETDDILVMWREWGDKYEGGWLDHIFAQGIFENITKNEVEDLVDVATGRATITQADDD